MRRRELARHEADIGFTPSREVRWLDPPELARTALKAMLAQVFADYGDRREVQAALPGGLVELAHQPDGDLWIDFAADLGDGFDATYTVASLLAQPDLTVDGPGTSSVTLPRGHLLVFGGDEVYPAASARGYENKTLGPYGAALPAAPKGTPRDATNEPSLLALPGNHDWYDGLTAFLRVFTRGAAIGGWRTVQSRSYFATRLGPPGKPGWWLLGLDSQLTEYIDEPQLEYFRSTVTAFLRPGDAVILCCAEPGWAHTGTDPDGFNQLHFFEREIVRFRRVPGTQDVEDTGARVRLWISGDSHHYARFTERPPDGQPSGPDPRSVQAVTCGLGGAYLSETHRLPSHIALPPTGSRMRDKDPVSVPFDRTGPTLPDASTSPALCRRIANPFSVWWAGRRNVGLLMTAGYGQVLLVGLVAVLLSLGAEGSFVDVLRTATLDSAARFALVALGWIVVLLALHLVMARLMPRGRLPHFVTFSLGAAFQLVVTLLLVLLVVAVQWPSGWSPALVLGLCAVLVWVVGAVLGTEAFALLLLTQGTGKVATWQMSGQAVPDDKGFVRMHLREDGSLELYVLVVDTVCRDWELDSTGTRPVPAGGPLTARLLDGPIVIAREGYSR
ncbi:hypothetical protein [Cellulomonas sp. URHD0024]|uniref:hypothetical protein n=1 Tax=Cellulomonas sp. URHD0024 TaxID=1302620 RepID=UPI0004114235|nr:hypothetical protein [Cellulomonas sp. URHD0024]